MGSLAWLATPSESLSLGRACDRTVSTAEAYLARKFGDGALVQRYLARGDGPRTRYGRLPQASAQLHGLAAAALVAFFAFAALDYLDGVVARERDLATSFGRVFDRVTDYPLLIGLSYLCLDVLPLPLVIAKLAVDATLLLLYVLGRGSTENRLRTAISYTTLLALMILSQGWLSHLVSPATVIALLSLSIAFAPTVALYNLDVLQKRFIADGLSLMNLACGVMSMVVAVHGQLELSLVFLLLGATFDGFDGAAARRWGGTRWGVYSDDVADGVNFGVAPGVIVALAVGGIEGALIGLLYATCTIGRLLFFTVAKSGSDPNYFRGVPSTAGAVIAICAATLFSDQAALVGLLVGIACAQMIAFSTHYRHLGRLLAEQRAALLKTPIALLPIASGALLGGTTGAIAALLAVTLVYALQPNVSTLRKALRQPS